MPALDNDGIDPGDGSAILSDPWLSREDGVPTVFPRIPASDVYVVTADQQHLAQERLTTRSWSEVLPDEARRYVGRPIEMHGSTGKLVLLRSLRVRATEAGEEPGDVMVEWNDGVAHTRFGALRHRYFPVEHVALVAILPELPRQVYVDCQIAIY
jgi:hypothetical protein